MARKLYIKFILTVLSISRGLPLPTRNSIIWFSNHIKSCVSSAPAKCHLSYLLTDFLTPCSTVLLENLTVSQPVKKFPAFYGTRMFLTVLTSARHLSLSCTSSIRSTPPTSYFLKIYLNINLPSTPGSPNLSLSLSFLHQNPVYFSPPYALHTPPISIFSIRSPEQYRVKSTYN